MISPASTDAPSSINTNVQPDTNRAYILYPRRFAVLAIFCICSLSSGFQWIEYVIIQNIIVRYYNESLPEGYDAKNNAVTWTSLLYMVISQILIKNKFKRIFLIGHLYSINVSRHVAIGSLWNENNMFNRSISQWFRCNN